MDTPCQPSRRKLKRVLKKVEKLNSSQKLSQKKLKAAINTSLNSTNSLRSLKKNNYSLALRLESVKEELNLIKNEKCDLLEENFALKEKVNSLEQMLLEGEGHKQVRVDGIKKVVKSLNNHMSNFCVDLEQLAQICFTRSSSLESQRSLDIRRISASRDSGDCAFPPESCGKSPNSVGQDDVSAVAEMSPGGHCEQQYASSIRKMRDIERRVQTESELPRRVQRSFYCLEEDEDSCIDSNGLEMLNGLLQQDDSFITGLTDVEPPLSLDLTENLDHGELEINSDKKSASLSRSKKRKKVSKQPTSVGMCKDLHIANQFALNAVHMNIIEKNKAVDEDASLPEPVDVGCADIEQTIHTATDMELTMPVDTTVLTTKNPENFETFRESLSSVKPRRLTRVLPEISDDQTLSQSLDELVPDAVTMRKMKPGQFKFAVGRKDSEGCRKEVVNLPRARSKSKKRIAELVEQLPREEPKSIFDFHEKTPKFSSVDNDALSVYSLADESASSPCAPLRKNKDTRRATHSVGGLNSKESNEDGAECVSSSEYSVPLKDNPSNMPQRISRLSRSRSKRRTKNTRRSSIVDDAVLEQEDNNGLTLVGGTTYSEPLNGSPQDQSKKASGVSRGRSISRRRAKPLSDVNTVLEQEDGGLTLVGGTTYSEPLNDTPQDQSKKASGVSRGRSISRRRTKPLSDVNTVLEQEDDGLTLVGGTTYSEPLNDSPQDQSKKASGVSRGRSRSRRRTKPLSDVNTVLEQEDGGLTLVGGTTYSEPLNDSPQDQSKKSSGVSRGRSRSRRRTKPLSDVNTVLEQEDDGGSTLVGGTTYSEPLNDSPQDQSKKASGVSRGRSRSRRRTKPLSDVNTVLEQEDDGGSTLVGRTTYSEPLKDSPQDQSKKASGVSRGRSISRRRTKPLSDVTTVLEQEDGGGSTLVGGTTYSEPLKDCPNAVSKKSSRAPRSRSRRRTKTLLDVNTDFLSDAESLDETPKKLSKLTRSRSQRSTKKTNNSNGSEDAYLDENDEFFKHKQSDPATVLEGMAHSPTLFDSPNKTSKNIPEASSVKDVGELCELNGEDFALGTEDLVQGGEKISSLLGEGVTYSEPLKDSPVKTPKVNGKSRSESTGRFFKSNKGSVTDNNTRSSGRSRKLHSETEPDAFNQDCSSLQADTSAKLKEQSLKIVKFDEVSGLIEYEKNSDLALITDVFDSDKGHISSNQELASGNKEKGKKSNRSKRLKNVEKDDISVSDPEVHREDILDDDAGSFSKSKNQKECQIHDELKTIERKRGRPRKLKNQELETQLSYCNDSNVNTVDSGCSLTTNDTDAHSELDSNDRGDGGDNGCGLPCMTSDRMPMPAEGRETNYVSEKCEDQDAEKEPSLKSCISSVKKSRKRKHTVKDNSCVDETESKDKLSLSSGNVRSKQSAKSGVQQNEPINDIPSTSQAADQCGENQSISESMEVCTGLKSSFSHSQRTPPKKEEKHRSSFISRKDSPAPKTSLTPESRDFQLGRQRRTKQVTSYAEPSINCKLRRGDPFTAVQSNLQIFKSPKVQGKKKKRRNVLESVQNFSIADSPIME